MIMRMRKRGNMYNLDEIVRIYFSCVPVLEVLNGNIDCHSFKMQDFQRLTKAYFHRYTDTENQNLYEFIKGSNKVEGHPYAGLENRSALNVFAVLEELAEQLLIMGDNSILCKYSELLRLRYVTNYIDEDLLICAYLVGHKARYHEAGQHRFFGWDMIIGHNNVQLRGMLREGISENHFHLYGSAPIFNLTWLNYMNVLPDADGMKRLREIGARPRTSRYHYYVDYQEEDYGRVVLKAALIRSFLIFWLIEDDFWNDKGESLAEKIPLFQKERVGSLLENKERIEDYYSEIRNAIELLKSYFLVTRKEEMIDYALYLAKPGLNHDLSGNLSFAGERWFLYQMLEKEMSGKRIEKKFFQWFYAYLVIKNNLRSEIVQTNTAIGFENFQIYTKRKNLYQDNENLARTAVYSSLLANNLRFFEIRVTPAESAAECAREIRECERLFGMDKEERAEIHLYYVFHFTKRRDEFFTKLEEAYKMSELDRQAIMFQAGYECRHYQQRKELNHQANELRKFREWYPKQAEKVLGIDACSQEIGCRPEVFACVFRFLADHVVDNMPDENVRQLKMTYHVGEDFLDVVDGLRAVDEAVRFLNLQYGSRIGHGTVLGIDVKKWYERKQYTIVLSWQDYLDNIAWMYHKLTEFNIQGCESLQCYLEEQFDIYFSKIYLKHMPLNENQKFIHSNSIHAYYEAWKLRGDEPELYIKGEFKKETDIQYTGRNYLINYRYPESFESRKRPEVAGLYYMYHYDCNVRDVGRNIIEVQVPPLYVEGAYRIQKEMQRYIASCGIGIEANPSSNLLISTMDSYDEHPIVRLYNKDLTYDNDKLRECAQLNVSINTDDKGVFRTSLENEYALMACALEKVRDKDGKPVYNQQMIYQWLDNIRKMGNLQSFYQEKINEMRIKNSAEMG